MSVTSRLVGSNVCLVGAHRSEYHILSCRDSRVRMSAMSALGSRIPPLVYVPGGGGGGTSIPWSRPTGCLF